MPKKQPPDELTLAYDEWKINPTSDTLGIAIQKAQPVLSSAVKTYGNGMDLNSKAKVLAIKAFNTYDKNKGASLSSHIFNQLQPLRREALKRTNVLGVSERYTQEKGKIRDSMESFLDKHSRDPSDVELADLTGLSTKRIQYLNSINNSTMSETQYLGNSGDDDDVSLPGVASPTKENTWINYVYHDSSPIDQKILEWKTGFKGGAPLTSQEIAKRLNITPAAVSQRAAKLSTRIGEGLLT